MLDIINWSPLQTRVTMAVATAKYDEFGIQAFNVGELVRLKLLGRAEAADLLHEAAIYNSLIFEYGADAIQLLMSDGLR